jgi:hypothetical protein
LVSGYALIQQNQNAPLDLLQLITTYNLCGGNDSPQKTWLADKRSVLQHQAAITKVPSCNQFLIRSSSL